MSKRTEKIKKTSIEELEHTINVNGDGESKEVGIVNNLKEEM
jgi:hypothetical protein